MATHLQIFAVLLPALVLWVGSGVAADDAPRHRAELVFPLSERHNHAPGIVELPDGQLLVSWYRGAGERKADDVVVLGARLAKGA
jgi:predicted neuraminidase